MFCPYISAKGIIDEAYLILFDPSLPETAAEAAATTGKPEKSTLRSFAATAILTGDPKRLKAVIQTLGKSS